MLPEKSLTEINFHAFKAGDEKIFEDVFHAWYDRIVTFCKTFIQDLPSAEGISQESFINLWLNKHKIEKPTGIPSFLYTVARSRCLNHLQKEKIREQHLHDSLKTSEIELNLKALNFMEFTSTDFTELEEVFQSAINKLSPRCREAFVKSRVEGKKYAEIAEEMNISIKAVEANISRALVELRVHLADYLPGFLIATLFRIF